MERIAKKDRQIMAKAVLLAKKGNNVFPNPRVGAVLVKNNKIIGTGFHKKFGGDHAEIAAMKSVKNKRDLENSTLFLTLEPCCHFGKTPPCVDAIIKNKIGRVVIGAKDPNPLVSGQGIVKLKKNKIKITLLNLPEAKKLLPKKPKVILKLGISLDGKITHPENRYITNAKSLNYVHKLRNKVDAILVGHNTFRKDKPKLNCRLAGGKNPRKIILSKKKINLKKLLFNLGKQNVKSVLVEGGKQTATSFLREKLVDEAYIFISPEFFGEKQLSMFGLLEKIVKLNNTKVQALGDNILVKGHVQYY